MMNVSHVETAMTDQPEPASSKVDGRSWGEKARALIGDGAGHGRQVVGIVLGGLLLAGLALLLLTFGGSGDPGGPDPALVGSWHSIPRERHPLELVITPPPRYTLVLNRGGSYRWTYVVNNRTVVIDGTWSAGEGHLTLQESRTFLGLMPGKVSRNEYRMTDFRPIDKSLGRGLELKNVAVTLERYSLIDDAALQKAVERLVRPR